MKYLCTLLVFFFTLSSLVAQEQADFPTSRLFKVQLGYYHPSNSLTSFAGVNMLNLGTVKFNAVNKLGGVDLFILGFQNSSESYPPGIESKFVIKNDWYKSYLIFGNPRKGLYIGSMISAGFFSEKFTRLPWNRFDRRFRGFNLGMGLRLDYFLHVSKRNLINISLRYSVLDWETKAELIPYAPTTRRGVRNRELKVTVLRSRLPLFIGITFPMSKNNAK